VVWNNKGATPQQVLAALGTDAGQLFVLSEKLADILTTAGATDIATAVPASWTYVANADGSVAVTAVPASK
jgi:hypothetical protein